MLQRVGSRKYGSLFLICTEKLEEYHNLVSGNEIFLSRIKGVGKYDAETAIAYGLSGANLRCTGVDWDLRKTQPYSLYNRFEFDVPVRNGRRLL